MVLLADAPALVPRHDPRVLGDRSRRAEQKSSPPGYSIVDPNFHVPANAFLFSVILGLTSVAVHIRQHQGQSVVVFRISELRLPRRLRLAMHPLALVLTPLWRSASAKASPPITRPRRPRGWRRKGRILWPWRPWRSSGRRS